MQRFLILCVFLLVGCEPRTGRYVDARPAQCGRIHVGGNVVVPYGIEPLDCEQFEIVAATMLEKGDVVLMSGICWLVGEGADARFDGGCEVPSDQYYYEGTLCRPSAPSSWVVPHSIGESMEPLRNKDGEISANVFVAGDESLQLRLIHEGVARVSCVPSMPGDTCYRLQMAERAEKNATMD
jgi:hypothetical protein